MMSGFDGNQAKIAQAKIPACCSGRDGSFPCGPEFGLDAACARELAEASRWPAAAG
jgi:hypothetical protein